MYRILLVDDEILVRDAIRENIDWKAMDCELVGVCENGQEAAEFVKSQEVDIVLTDICMPYMDGMELSHYLHDNYPDIVIVIFSGFSDFEYAKKAIQYDVSEYLLKPVTAMELTGVISRMKEKVEQRKAERRKMESLTQVSQKYHKNALVIRSKAIEELVKCTQDVEVSLKQMKELGIDMDVPSYRVAVFDMDIYSDMYQLEVEKYQESALMAFVLFNISDELVSQANAGVAYQEGSSRVCVLFMGEHTRDFSNRILEICRDIQQKVKEVIGIAVSIGIGSWVKAPDKLLLSYKLAEKAMQYRYLLGGNLLIDMDERKTTQNLSLQEPLEAFVNAMKTGKKETMELMLAKMEQAIKDAYADKSLACVYLQQIVRAVAKAWETVNADSDEITRTREEMIILITEQKSFQKAIGLVKDYAERIFENMQKFNSSSMQRQAVLAQDYIQNNYMDPGLNLNSICNYLNISTSYFSTIFKEATGETFIEALVRVRMEKARELLEHTTLKNYEIAEKVGFSDPHYFGISFKKMTGKTPTEYAREKRK